MKDEIPKFGRFDLNTRTSTDINYLIPKEYTEVRTIFIGDDKIKIVCDTRVPKDECWFIDVCGNKQIIKIREIIPNEDTNE